MAGFSTVIRRLSTVFDFEVAVLGLLRSALSDGTVISREKNVRPGHSFASTSVEENLGFPDGSIDFVIPPTAHSDSL